MSSANPKQVSNTNYNIDPKLDLLLERIVDVPRELVWQAWTTPEHLVQWFCPKPWMTTECEIDLRPGGLFRTIMKGPDGEKHEGNGCYLEVIENERLTWTDALVADFRPAGKPNACIEDYFSATLILEPHEKGTKYVAIARHSNEASRKTHNERGFEQGWGTALDQLVEMIKSSKIN